MILFILMLATGVILIIAGVSGPSVYPKRFGVVFRIADVMIGVALCSVSITKLIQMGG